MTYFDVFNGDADGICSLIQLRLADPRDSELVTGVKRDINLLSKVWVEEQDQVTALDISFEKNAQDVERLLLSGASVLYVDHHRAGELPLSVHLEAHIDTAAELCTGLIVDRLLEGRYRAWALVAAYGDNLDAVADTLGRASGFQSAELEVLRKLGIAINYNGYGASLDDLNFKPAELYRLLYGFETPFAFIEEKPELFARLLGNYERDMACADAVTPGYQDEKVAVYHLPNEKWARRVGGVLGNALANESPARAHAVVTEKADGDLQVSVRAPLNNRCGADELVAQFPTGGGRKAAAGINALSASQLDDFIAAFKRQYSD